MADYVIYAVLAVAVLLAFRAAARHFSGRGGCCGGGAERTVKAEAKKLSAPVTAERVVSIGGMHCENCAARVQNALNSIDGVSAEVHLADRTALVKMSRPVDDGELRSAVARAGYEVVSVKAK
ncbi:MAG: heavy-metal-associated domain-containing protein [Pyramidobacter sp.]